MHRQFLMIFTAMFLAFQGSAVAAEQNRVILGDDFSYLQTPNARACENACEGAEICVAWTFIHRGRQCRLKSSIYEQRTHNCCTSGTIDRTRRQEARRGRGHRQRMTVCRFQFHGNATGWRERRWRARDCTSGLPPLHSVAIGQAKNGNGTSGQADCTSQFGRHYNNPQLHGATSGEVICLFVSR